jgi:hypothetical protein
MQIVQTMQTMQTMQTEMQTSFQAFQQMLVPLMNTLTQSSMVQLQSTRHVYNCESSGCTEPTSVSGCTQCNVRMCKDCVTDHNRRMKDHNVVDVHKYGQSSTRVITVCGIDGCDGSSTHGCVDCKQPLCGPCRDNHARKLNYRSHQVKTIHDYLRPIASQRKKRRLDDDLDTEAADDGNDPDYVRHPQRKIDRRSHAEIMAHQQLMQYQHPSNTPVNYEPQHRFVQPSLQMYQPQPHMSMYASPVQSPTPFSPYPNVGLDRWLRSGYLPPDPKFFVETNRTT